MNHELPFKVISTFANKNVAFAKGFRHYSEFRLFSLIHYHHHFPYIMLPAFMQEILNFPPKYFNKTILDFNSKKHQYKSTYKVDAHSQGLKIISAFHICK